MDAYVVWNGAAYFVKEAKFFQQQKDVDKGDWSKNWRKLYDVEGIEHAREVARRTWGSEGERWTDRA